MNHISKFDEKKLADLKEVLDKQTFVGEFIGGFDNQHITDERKSYVKFYCSILKEKMDDIIPLEIA